MILKIRPGMQDHVVVEKLDVARFKVHSKTQIVACQSGVEAIQSLDLFRGQPRNFWKGRLRTIDVVAHMATCEPAVAAPEDGHLKPRRFLRCFLPLATEDKRL